MESPTKESGLVKREMVLESINGKISVYMRDCGHKECKTELGATKNTQCL